MNIKDIQKDPRRFRKRLKKGHPYKPVFVKMKLLWDCNLKCKMCNHWRWRGNMLDKKILKKLIPDLAKMGCTRIHISGGEPTMYPHLIQSMNWMRKQGIKITMTTNATLITEKKAIEMVNAGLKKVNISFDSPDIATHDDIRGMKGAFERSVRGAKYLQEAFVQKTGNPKAPAGKIFINMVVNQANYQQVTQLPELAEKIGTKGFHLIPIYTRNQELTHLNQEQIIEFNESIAPLAYEKSQQLGLEVAPHDLWVFGTSKEQINSSAEGNYAHDYYKTHPCYALWTHALIDHNGNVAPCCTLTEQVVIGNLRENSFKEIWNGDEFTRLRQASYPIHSACNRCTMFLPKNKQIEEMLGQ